MNKVKKEGKYFKQTDERFMVKTYYTFGTKESHEEQKYQKYSIIKYDNKTRARMQKINYTNS